MIEKELADLDAIMNALANQHRRQIIYMLGLQPASILQLANALGLTLPAIHRHIKVLEEAGLVLRKKNGRVNFLALNRKGLLRMQDWIHQYQVYWGTNQESLENYIKGIKDAEERINNKQ